MHTLYTQLFTHKYVYVSNQTPNPFSFDIIMRNNHHKMHSCCFACSSFFLTKKLLYTRQVKCVCVFSIHIHSIIYPSIHHHHRNQFTYNFLLVCVTDGQLFSEKMRWWCDVVFLIVTFLCIEDLEARSFYRVKWVFTTFPLTLSWWRRWLSSSFSK